MYFQRTSLCVKRPLSNISSPLEEEEGGDDQTTQSTPVNIEHTNQQGNLLGWFSHCCAHHPGTFSIVWPLTELLFFSLVSPRDPKWDLDILARSSSWPGI